MAARDAELYGSRRALCFFSSLHPLSHRRRAGCSGEVRICSIEKNLNRLGTQTSTTFGIGRLVLNSRQTAANPDHPLHHLAQWGRVVAIRSCQTKMGKRRFDRHRALVHHRDHEPSCLVTFAQFPSWDFGQGSSRSNSAFGHSAPNRIDLCHWVFRRVSRARLPDSAPRRIGRRCLEKRSAQQSDIWLAASSPRHRRCHLLVSERCYLGRGVLFDTPNMASGDFTRFDRLYCCIASEFARPLVNLCLRRLQEAAWDAAGV